MGWPWRRFESFFKRHLARKAAEDLTRQRDLMLAAINSNPTWDEKDNADVREKRIEAINEGWRIGVEMAHGVRDAAPVSSVDDALANDPLFRSLRSQGAGAASAVAAPQPDEAGLGAAILG